MKKFLDRFKYIWVFAGYYLAMAMIIVLISKYLKDKGLTADGLVGDETYALLMRP